MCDGTHGLIDFLLFPPCQTIIPTAFRSQSELLVIWSNGPSPLEGRGPPLAIPELEGFAASRAQPTPAKSSETPFNGELQHPWAIERVDDKQ